MNEHRQVSTVWAADLLGLFARSLRRLWWLCLVLIVLCTALFGGYARLSYRAQYTASMTFLVNAGGTAQSGTSTATAAQMAKTFPYILTSGLLDSAVCADTGLTALPAISATSEEDTNLCTLSVTGTDAQHALKMATQAREPVAWYEHTELGYNYRMSNICAGIGRGQMEVLEQRVAQKRAIHDRYRDALAGLPLQLPAEPEDVRSNRWLTAALLAPDCGVTPGQIIAALAEHNIEARHIWKPMHLQPVFRDCAFVKTAERSVAEDVFARGVCLPSDTKMTPEQQAQVCAVIRGLF